MSDRFVEVLGLRVRVIDSGARPTPGPAPILLIHGVGGWAENWQEVFAPLAETGRRVIAVDLPGFGMSDRPRRVHHFDPARPFYARFTIALLDALALEHAHIVGNSLGGAVAYTAAVTAPARARSLTLVATGGLGHEVPLFLRLCTLPGVGLLTRMFRNPSSADSVLRSCFYDQRRVPPYLSEQAARLGIDSFPEFVRALRAGVSIRGVRRGVRREWVRRAGRYTGPVLVIWGNQDPVLPVSDAALVAEVFPRAVVHLIDACGHLPQIEQPAAFLGSLVPFLDAVERPVPST